MKVTVEKVNCPRLWKNSRRMEPFEVVKLGFDVSKYTEDRLLLEKLHSKAAQIATSVHPASANALKRKRDEALIITHCLAGVLSEYAWWWYLNEGGRALHVLETPFVGAATQFDLVHASTGEVLEIRASFPRNGVAFALCHPTLSFDVIGSYQNNYKPGEVNKALYLRSFIADFHPNPKSDSLWKYVLSHPTEVILAGGATSEMLQTHPHARSKELIPDMMGVQESHATYHTLSMTYALDTAQIAQLVKSKK